MTTPITHLPTNATARQQALNRSSGFTVFYDAKGRAYEEISADLYQYMSKRGNTANSKFDHVYLIGSPGCVRPNNLGVVKVGVSAASAGRNYNQRLGDYEKYWGKQFKVYGIQLFNKPALALAFEKELKQRLHHLDSNSGNPWSKNLHEWFHNKDLNAIQGIYQDMAANWQGASKTLAAQMGTTAHVPVKKTLRAQANKKRRDARAAAKTQAPIPQPTGVVTRAQAKQLGIPLTIPQGAGVMDLTKLVAKEYLKGEVNDRLGISGKIKPLPRGSGILMKKPNAVYNSTYPAKLLHNFYVK